MKQHEKKPGNENRDRKAKNVVEILLVVAAILLIPLFFAIRTAANPPATPKTATPHKPAATIAPGSATKVKEPPPCTFPLAPIAATETAPESYTFSEPKVVLTSSEDLYDVVEWLPDNQRALMTRELRSPNNKTIQQSIELFNPQTSEIQVYATRNQTAEPPSWLPELNAVVFPAMHILSVDEKNHRYQFTRQIWVSHGNPQATELIADNLPQYYVAVKPSGGGMLYLSDKRIIRRNGLLKDLPSSSFDSSEWDYSKGRARELPISYEMIWQPGTAFIFLYSDGDTGGGYTFILDSNTGQVCELKLGGWAARAKWSPNGRYLAIARFQGGRPTESSDLAVLDAATGKLYTMRVTPEDMVGKHYVSDIAWAPDNRHVLAVGSVLSSSGAMQNDSKGLYLVDFVSGQSDPILPAYAFSTDSSRSSNLAWSPDGSQLLARCPTVEEERICLVSVQQNVK